MKNNYSLLKFLCFVFLLGVSGWSNAQIGNPTIEIEEGKIEKGSTDEAINCLEPTEENAPKQEIGGPVTIVASTADSAMLKYIETILFPDSGFKCTGCPGRSTCEMIFVKWRDDPPKPTGMAPNFTFPALRKFAAKITCTGCTVRVDIPVEELELDIEAMEQIQLAAKQNTNAIIINTLSAYPNPASEVLHVEVDGDQDLSDVSLVIYSTLGQVLQSQKIGNLPKGFSERTLDVSQLPVGLYFLVLYAEKAQIQALEFNITK